MTMEKFGVSDKTQLQKMELGDVRDRLRALRVSTEKTASVTSEIEQLERRESELRHELADEQ